MEDGEFLDEVLQELCGELGVHDVATALERRMVEVEGFECSFEQPDEDSSAVYLMFDYGMPTAGRTLRLYKAMLEANLVTYAQDAAQLGLDPDTGVIILIVRIESADARDAAWLADTLKHYAEHGKYWRDNLFKASDEMFEAIAAGDYQWIRA